MIRDWRSQRTVYRLAMYCQRRQSHGSLWLVRDESACDGADRDWMGRSSRADGAMMSRMIFLAAASRVAIISRETALLDACTTIVKLCGRRLMQG